LKGVLSDLRVDHVLGRAAVHEIYLSLASIIGQWMSEEQRLEVSSVAGSLLSTAKSLNEAVLTLGGFETGLHSDLEIAVATRIAKYLALVPGVSPRRKNSFHHFGRRLLGLPTFAWWLVLIFPIDPRNSDGGHCIGTTHSQRSYCRSPRRPISSRPWVKTGSPASEAAGYLKPLRLLKPSYTPRCALQARRRVAPA
jgi:hypothetical protein